MIATGRALFVLGVASSGAALPAAAQPPRARPGATAQRCVPPRRARLDSLPVRTLERWAGIYRLTVVGTQGVSGDRPVRGTLRLTRPDAAHRTVRPNPNLPRHVLTFPLRGTLDAPLTRIASLSLAWPPQSDAPNRPGVGAGCGSPGPAPTRTAPTRRRPV